MLKITDQYFWNFVFLMFFIVLTVMVTIILEGETRIPLAELTFTDFALITLATWRLTRLFVYDEITNFFREQFFEVVKVGRGYELEKPKFGPRRTVADLLSCPWCFSIFSATVIIFLYFITSYALYPILILAISAFATFLQNTSSLVGNKVDEIKNSN